MKVLIQNAATLSFYRGGGKWTAKMHEARVFTSSEEALAVSQNEEFRGVVVLLFFPENNRQMSRRRTR